MPNYAVLILVPDLVSPLQQIYRDIYGIYTSIWLSSFTVGLYFLSGFNFSSFFAGRRWCNVLFYRIFTLVPMCQVVVVRERRSFESLAGGKVTIYVSYVYGM